MHEYKKIVLGTVMTRVWWSEDKTQRPVEKVQYVCAGCGHRRTYVGGSRWGGL